MKTKGLKRTASISLLEKDGYTFKTPSAIAATIDQMIDDADKLSLEVCAAITVPVRLDCGSIVNGGIVLISKSKQKMEWIL